MITPTPDQQRLLGIMFDVKRSSKERAEAGRIINDFGDPRPGVGLRPDGLPDLMWCEVPEGEFIMGSDEDKDHGNPKRTLALPKFSIAKYPITFAQFQPFVDALEGFNNDQWWPSLSRKDWKGSIHSFQRANRPSVHNRNHPREYVSWFAAVAFCRWLSAKLGYEVRLPTEEEWEKAARGTDGRIYPYGDQFNPAKGNVRQTGILHACAVGLFPAGASPYGVLDMSGNLQEWTLTEYKIGSNGINHKNSRVLKGGGRNIANPFVLRAAYRHSHRQRLYWDFGIRCVRPL